MWVTCQISIPCPISASCQKWLNNLQLCITKLPIGRDIWPESTVTSLVLRSDMLMAADTWQVSLLTLRDFICCVCIKNDFLLHQLQVSFGMTGVILQWILLFLTSHLVLIVGNRISVVRVLYRIVLCHALPDAYSNQMLYQLISTRMHVQHHINSDYNSKLCISIDPITEPTRSSAIAERQHCSLFKLRQKYKCE